jgi:diacylglycerol kinase (ATP)
MANTDKWFLICNPIAKGGRMKKRWPKVQKQLDHAQLAYDFAFTKANNHAIEITQEKIREGYRKIAVLGGDGTINEVVNGMFTQKEVSTEALLFGLIPLGTANDWARTHKLPKQTKKAILLLKKGKVHKQDVGLATFEYEGVTRRRYFNNVAGMAYDAFVVKYIEDAGSKNMNKLKYIYYVLHCLFMYELPEALVRYAGREFSGPAYTVNIGICKYNGGGLRLVPQAIADDGKLALTIAGKLSRWQVIANMYRFYTGSLGEMKQVITKNPEGSIEVLAKGKREIRLELDGEFMGYTPARFELIPKSLSFVGH